MTRRIVKAMGALIALALLTIGMPAALLAMGGDPRDLLPGAWPAREDIFAWTWYRLRDAWNTGQLVFHGLLLVAWLAWLALMWLTTLEFVTQLRFGAAHARDRLAGLGPRRWIGGLVSTVLLLGNPAQTTTATGPPPIADVVASALHHPVDVQPTSATVTPATPGGIVVAEPNTPTSRCPEIRVVAGDTLWGLAEDHLGDGTRFTEIVALNRERLRHGPDHLEIGWVLRLPPDATDVPDPAKTRPCTGDRTVEVNVGDTLSAIAKRELGDSNQWKVIFDANVRQPQPDGRALRRPDLILPGWTLRIPAAVTSPKSEQPRTPEPDPPEPDVEQREPETASPDPEPTQPDLAGPPGPTEAPEPHPGTGISLPTGAYVGLGLAALITVAAISVRLWRQRTWPPGSLRRDELTTPPVVRGMRLAHDIATRPRDNHGELVYLRHTGDRPGPLGMMDDALATAITVQPEAGHTTIGIAEGRPVAIDIARTGGIGLTGPGAVSAARALVVDLLAGVGDPESNRAPVLLMPGADAEQLLGISDLSYPPLRLHTTSTLPDALDWLEGELLTRTRTESSAEPADPLVLVSSSVPDQHQRLRAILDTGGQAGFAAILIGAWDDGTTIQVGPTGNVEEVTGESYLDLGSTRMFSLPADDAHQLISILGQADAITDPAAVATEITASDERPSPTPSDLRTLDEPSPPCPRVEIPTSMAPSDSSTAELSPTTSEATDHANSDEPPLHLSVLGRMRLRQRDGRDLISSIEPKKREILTLLALHPDGIRRDTLIATLWPDATTDAGRRRFHGHLSRLRDRLKPAIGESSRDFVLRDDKHYSLNPDLITVDLWTVNRTIRRHAGGELDSDQALDALQRDYRAPLAPELDEAWLEAEREHLHQQVLGAMRALASSHDDDPDRKLATLDVIRKFDPTNEGIYREIIRSQARSGRHEAIEDTLDILRRELGKLDEQPSSEIIELARALWTQQPRR